MRSPARAPWVAAVLAMTLAAGAQGQVPQADPEPTSPRVRALAARVQEGDAGALAAFWAEVDRTGAPLVEPDTADPGRVLVTFVWRADEGTDEVAVVQGVAGWNPALNLLARVPGSDVFHRTYSVAREARFVYQFLPRHPRTSVPILQHMDSLVIDPLNPGTYPFYGGRRVSTFEGPDAPPQPWAERRRGVARGAVTVRRFHSQVLDNERTIWLYTPAGFDPEARLDPALLVVFDGDWYTTLVDTPTTLDNLIADGRIPPTVAVLVGHSEAGRAAELPPNRPFADFIAEELVPWVKDSLGIQPDPRRTVVAGSSHGGLAAAWLGYTHSEVFGNVLSQSGSYWWSPPDEPEPEWMARLYAAAPRLPLSFYLDVGRLEVGFIRSDTPTMLSLTRHMRDVLRAKGYDVHYREFEGGHEHYNWRGTLAWGLIELLGTGGA